MSKLSLTLKSLLAMGAATTLTITASADEPKTKPEIAEDAKAMVAGSGGGKATFKELTAADYPGIKDESQTTINEGCEPYPACARNKEEMEEEFEWQQGDVESEGDLALNAAAPNDKLGPIKGESQDRAAAIEFDGIDGEPVDKASVKDGEDRLTENLELNSTVKGEVSEDIEDAAEKTDPPKEIGPLRTRPMQRR